jgi:hypothetical protein
MFRLALFASALGILSNAAVQQFIDGRFLYLSNDYGN